VARSPNNCCHGKQQYFHFVTCLATRNYQQYKLLNAVMENQECFPFTVLSSGKLFGTAVNNISAAI